jgi:hypothetical protein
MTIAHAILDGGFLHQCVMTSPPPELTARMRLKHHHAIIQLQLPAPIIDFLLQWCLSDTSRAQRALCSFLRLHASHCNAHCHAGLAGGCYQPLPLLSPSQRSRDATIEKPLPLCGSHLKHAWSAASAPLVSYGSGSQACSGPQ